VRFEVEPPKELLADTTARGRQWNMASAPDPQQKIERVIAMLTKRKTGGGASF
jgi:hypothetical protein